MLKVNLSIVLFLSGFCVVLGQEKAHLTVQGIMRDPDTWIGSWPSHPFWSDDSRTLYFNWNPEATPSDSLYKIEVRQGSLQPQKVSPIERRHLPSPTGHYNKSKTRKLYIANGDVFLLDISSGRIQQITDTPADEKDPAFGTNEKYVTFTVNDNLYTLDLDGNRLKQLTHFIKEKEKTQGKYVSEGDQWLRDEQLELIEILRQRKEHRTKQESIIEQNAPKRPKKFYLEDWNVLNLQLSPSEKYITFVLEKDRAHARGTKVPNYVTESGYTEYIHSRSKAESDIKDRKVGIYNLGLDSIYFIKTDSLPGLRTLPDFKKAYGKTTREKREIILFSPLWSPDGKYAVVVVRSKDNKDRWITLLDGETGALKVLDHQHDEAWVGGPGIGWVHAPGKVEWLSDSKHIWFQSEETGYSHLYVLNIETLDKRAVTQGSYEVYNPVLSKNEQHWYFEANMKHPGEKHLYTALFNGEKIRQLTSKMGKHHASISPDEKHIALLYSFVNRPPELFLMPNPVTGKQGVMKQITHSVKDSFQSYSWRVPEIITFKARDSADVYARVFVPDNLKEGAPAVIFVHGAGYLQNVHYGWSSYFREYMFHNLLADKGYLVMDIDYRGSAGYGRDCRTAIYRHMGGKDLTDHIDGAGYLVEQYKANPKKIGIYGGSYGGFITLMAMFKHPEVFAAGAALRSVTDWAHYNHTYTASILNTPSEDSVAYKRSSPIYFAEGLEGALLICHGLVDTNVHAQDVIRLTQRLIELEKENWELAIYPMEDHAFLEESSWTDEYRRVLKLFEENLR